MGTRCDPTSTARLADRIVIPCHSCRMSCLASFLLILAAGPNWYRCCSLFFGLLDSKARLQMFPNYFYCHPVGKSTWHRPARFVCFASRSVVFRCLTHLQCKLPAIYSRQKLVSSSADITPKHPCRRHQSLWISPVLSTRRNQRASKIIHITELSPSTLNLSASTFAARQSSVAVILLLLLLVYLILCPHKIPTKNLHR